MFDARPYLHLIVLRKVGNQPTCICILVFYTIEFVLGQLILAFYTLVGQPILHNCILYKYN